MELILNVIIGMVILMLLMVIVILMPYLIVTLRIWIKRLRRKGWIMLFALVFLFSCDKGEDYLRADCYCGTVVVKQEAICDIVCDQVK